MKGNPAAGLSAANKEVAALDGKLEAQANRTEALKTLKEMVRAIEMKDEAELKKNQALLEEGKYAALMVDKDYEDVLWPLLARDPEAIDFLEGLGWEFQKEK